MYEGACCAHAVQAVDGRCADFAWRSPVVQHRSNGERSSNTIYRDVRDKPCSYPWCISFNLVTLETCSHSIPPDPNFSRNQALVLSPQGCIPAPKPHVAFWSTLQDKHRIPHIPLTGTVAYKRSFQVTLANLKPFYGRRFSSLSCAELSLRPPGPKLPLLLPDRETVE